MQSAEWTDERMQAWMDGRRERRDRGREQDWPGQQTSISESCGAHGRDRPWRLA